MFVHTNEINAFLINLDSLIHINSVRRPTTRILTSLPPDTRITMRPDILEALQFITQTYPHAFVSAHSPKVGHFIRTKLNRKLEWGSWCSNQDNRSCTSVGRQIQTAMEKNGFYPGGTIYFTGDPDTLEDAHKANLGTICWFDNDQDQSKIYDMGPDFMVSTVDKLKAVCEGACLGYLSEIQASPKELFPEKPKIYYYQFIIRPNDERAGEFIYVGGRYFSTKDPRYQKHALSLRLISSKTHINRHLKPFALIIAGMVHRVGNLTKTTPDLITRIPPKPNQADRLGKQLASISFLVEEKRHLKIPFSKIAPSVLWCRQSFPSQKSVGFKQRRSNVRGVFEVRQNVTGKTVYVLDDILTTGSTLKEACRVLYAAGAARVIPMAIAYHPKTIEHSSVKLICKNCQGEIVARSAKNGGNLFFGCDSYKSKGCKVSTSFKKGLRLLNGPTASGNKAG